MKNESGVSRSAALPGTRWLIACGSVLLSGCATPEVQVDRADPRFSGPADGKILLAVERKEGAVCSSALVRVMVDNEHAGDVGPGEKLRLYVTPEIHVLAITPNARCPADVATKYFDMRNSQPVRTTVGFDFFGHIQFAE